MSRLTRRDFLRLAVAAAAWPLAACGKNQGPSVNFFNWSKYIGPDTLPSFTRETGIAVNYEEFADEEEMFAKLRSGARGYDLLIGTDYMISRLKGSNLIDPYPPGVLMSLGNLEAKFRAPPYDPELAFSVPYLWGTTGIGYNKAKLPKVPSSWLDLWDPRHQGKLSMLDNARDCVSVALLLKGFPETETSPEAFRQVKELLISQSPLIKQYSSTTYMDGLVAGELYLAMAWSGDVLQVARENPDIDYVIPKEGSYLWVDNLCLARGSGHREEALRLVDFLLRGDVAAGIANTVRYASPNAAAKAHLDKDLLKDPRVFPDAATASRLRFHAVLDAEASQLWNETWSDVKVAA